MDSLAFGFYQTQFGTRWGAYDAPPNHGRSLVLGLGAKPPPNPSWKLRLLVNWGGDTPSPCLTPSTPSASRLDPYGHVRAQYGLGCGAQ